ncbi:MAG TPA: metallophosphoesterase [Pyrinomonadaceae bacterium]
MRVFAISDLHTDFAANWNALQKISSGDYKQDALIIAGDIADSLAVISRTLVLLRSRFARVFYVTGNHELWVRMDNCHSVEKLNRILALCDNLGVETKPARVETFWIVPLFSWYDSAYDEDGSADTLELEGWGDYHFCRWPLEIKSVSDYLLNLNTPHIKVYDAPVISFSHFLPRRDLLPPTRKLKFKGLPRVAGSTAIDYQVRALKSGVHVFGHSHINCDRVIDGIRYVQNKMGYPRERVFSRLRLKQVWG